MSAVQAMGSDPAKLARKASEVLRRGLSDSEFRLRLDEADRMLQGRSGSQWQPIGEYQYCLLINMEPYLDAKDAKKRKSG